MSVIIAVDGPVAAGKGTLARRLAREFGYAYLDSGSLYRAVGLKVLQAGGDPADPAAAVAAARALAPADIEDPGLREERTAAAASLVAAIPGVRQALLDYQRDYARRPPGGEAGAVLDGRDIGTVVFPDAAAKLFVTARPEVRARRRYLEILARGGKADEAQVFADLLARDARDSGRSVAPLAAAPDACLLDTSELDIDSAFTVAKAFILKTLRLGR